MKSKITLALLVAAFTVGSVGATAAMAGPDNRPPPWVGDYRSGLDDRPPPWIGDY